MDCHVSSDVEVVPGHGSVALVGQPNVGKSVLFQKITGSHAVVSNYPGTTVEITRGQARSLPNTVVLDTPGVITFPPHTDDERVTERVLLHEPLNAILQVGDAKNLRRTLLLTVQLAEFGLPLVLTLNMMDEANARGVVVDHKAVSDSFSLPVVPITAIQGEGIEDLTTAIQHAPRSTLHINYPDEIEAALVDIAANLPKAPIAPRAIALLWLSGDTVIEEWLKQRVTPQEFDSLVSLRLKLQGTPGRPPSDVIQRTRLDYIQQVVNAALVETGTGWGGISRSVEGLMIHPLWGLPILAVILFALYWFVGVFGAGILVDLIEGGLFQQVINPWATTLVNRIVPFPILVDFLVGEYGLWTVGMTYALALILPIVTTFFLAFAFMEDTGYLPRLAVLTNRLFSRLGLNGKAVLPMVLGLGCVTMATLTTRVLESRRERVLVTFLLALAIPCSAQLGVVMGLLAGISFGATLIWSAVVLIVFLVVGWLAARVLPGERTTLLVELPPLRWPAASNLFIKTLARLEWYLKEVVPIFLIGTAALFVLDRTGVLAWILNAAEPLVTGWLGLPAEASTAFLMGFLRRDFGATGLFVMESQGLLTPLQVVVAMVTVTLFIPCLASVLMIYKERGLRTALGTTLLIFPLAFLVGGLLYRFLLSLGWGL
jgi:ferrous iron transport protein B